MCTITSFQRARLEETRAHAPELPTGWLVAQVDDATIAQARGLGLTQLCPRADTVTPDLVHRVHAEGFVARSADYSACARNSLTYLTSSAC